MSPFYRMRTRNGRCSEKSAKSKLTKKFVDMPKGLSYNTDDL